MMIEFPSDIPKPCIIQAAADYQVPPSVLYAIRVVEGGKIGECGANTNGTIDCGPFRINTSWMDRLYRQEKITQDAITNDACIAVRCAAYIVRYGINHEGDFWRGLGNYHSKTPSKNALYVSQIAPIAVSFDARLKLLGWYK